ncbi:uncharacterized protein N0V89_006329 [Didymosphaeria variabile]|uniref:Nephrocystin 3-like N-terminal domain-containing protein n=1 Tax=Didymosphaeria variabile TaxID=1932322 RepID=A0A9W9CC25_9PLEO|nr:uncharacterized protein N0V89_006329 [Didymosphaeria variabile]KAJ4354592.1 hypothetical protein N0V89_006329 [Didymosphaeria variabile]
MSSKPTQEDHVSADEEIEEYIMVESKDLRSVSELQAWLEPTDYLSPGNEYMKHIHSHVPGTGGWLRASKTFQGWKRPASQDATARNNCLWIKGVPGSGKSVFSASTAKQLHDDGNIVLYFFFRQIVATNHDPKYLVRDWLAQLLPHTRWLHRRLDELSRSNTGISKNLATLWDVLIQALLRIDKPVYCIADGLDEMDDTHANFTEQLKTLGTTDPLFNVKLLLTSRPIPRIEESLRDHTIIGIKLDPTMLYSDITHYVEVRLDTLEPKLGVAKYQEVKEAICERAKGLFLHARLMTDNLITGLREGTIVEETLPTSLERLPRNLKELYTEMLAEHSRRSGITQDQQFMILQCVVHSSRPLRLIELGSLIMMLRSDTGMGLKEGKSLVRQSCGRLLEILEDESVSVIHHSFTEFLRDTVRDDGHGTFPKLDKGKAHAMLVNIALKYLDKCEVPENALWVNPEDCDEVTSEEEDEEFDPYDHFDELDTRDGRSEEDNRKTAIVEALRLKYPLLDYVTGNLSHHITKADQNDMSTYSILDDIFQPSRPAFTIWLLMQWKSYRPANVTPLHVAGYLNWHSYARHLISKGVPVDRKDAEERTALSYAAEEGHVNVMNLLLQHGAEPDSDDRYGLKPLHYSAQEGKTEVVRLLLARGVSPITLKTKTTPEWIAEQFGSDEGETPLEYACQHGHTDIIKEFLPLVDQEWRQKAFGWVRNVENVEAVLQAGDISINQGDGLRTRLYQAASDFQVDIVRVLLKHGADPNARSRIKRDNTGSHSAGWPSPDGNTYLDGPTPLHGWANYDYWNRSYDGHGKASECFQLLLESGSDIHAEDGDGWTPLHCACKVQEDSMLGSWFDDAKDHLVKTLLEAGANPNVQMRHGSTPLHITSRPEVINMLVEHGADANITDNHGHTPLMAYLAPGAEKKKSATFEKLLQISAQPTQRQKGGDTPVHGLMRCLPKLADPVLFQALIKAGLDVNTRNTQGMPPLLVMEENDYADSWKDDEQSCQTYEAVFRTLKDAGMDMSITDPAGRTILHVLIGRYKRKVSTLQRFIEFGCDPHARDHNGATMLHYVIRKSESTHEMIDLFVNYGVDPRAVDHEGNSLMHELARASISFFPKFVEKLRKLRDLGVPTDTANRAARTPFHFICAEWRQSGQYKTHIEAFLKDEIIPRSNINAVDHSGATPLHYAAIACEVHVKQLLDAGADPEVLTYEGLSPLHLAARARQPNIVGQLLQEYKTRGVLEHYVHLKHVAWPHWTALHYACSSGRPESVRYLLEAGADPDALDIRGLSPVHVVAEFEQDRDPKREHMGRAESRFGVGNRTMGVRLKDHPGYGYVGDVHSKKTERTSDIIEMLARAGAQLDYERPKEKRLGERDRMTPMDLAVENGCTEMVIELRKRGYSSCDPLGENIVGRCLGTQEAEVLLQIPDTDDANVNSRQRDGPPRFSMSAKEKIERVLKLAAYDLLHELISKSEELRVEALHVLASWGHAFLLEELLDGMEDVDHKTTRDSQYGIESLLGTACSVELPNLEVIKVLLEKGKVNVNAQFRQQSVLHVLAEGRNFWHIEALDYVLSQSAEIDLVVKNGMTPLLTAASSEFGIWKGRTVATLLRHGADPSKLSAEGKSVLHFAETADDVRLLIEHGADLTLGTSSPLLFAIQHRRVDVVGALLQAGANPNALSMTSFTHGQDFTACYPLHEAAKRKDPYSVEVVETVLKKKEQIVNALLKHSADPMATYEDGATVLQMIIEDHGLAEPLLASSTLDLEKKGRGGRTPIISSCYPKKVDPTYPWQKQDEPAYSIFPKMAKMLIEKSDPCAIDNEGRTALHWLCTLPLEFDSASRDVFNLLTERAPSLIHLHDLNGCTPFSLAVTANQTWAIDTLLTLGVHPTSADPDGNTALHILAPRMFGQKPDADAASQRFTHFLSLGANINARNKVGSTPLSLFISKSYVPAFDSGGRQLPSTYKFETHSTHTSYLPIFLSAGADLFTVNDKGEGLLHLTASRADSSGYNSDHKHEITATFKALLEKGLDPRLEDGECRTSIDVAIARGNKDIVALFRDDDKA